MAQTQAGRTTIQWLGHSCFRIDNGINSIVIDPYNDRTGYPPLRTRASITVASHGHGDHNCLEAVVRLPYDGEASCAIEVGTIETFHDDAGGAQRGTNRVHIVRTGGFTIVHLGDLGHLLTDAQAEAIGRPDVLLVPVGGFYTIDAEQAAATVRRIRPRIVIPMHYRHAFGPDRISTVEGFLEAVRPSYQTIETGSDIIALDRSMEDTVLLMRFRRPD